MPTKPLNLSEPIRSIRGLPAPIAAPTPEEAAAAAGDPAKLPRETVGNMILTALSLYQVEDRRETFLVQMAAEATLSELEYLKANPDDVPGTTRHPFEYKDKVRALIVRALHQATSRKGPEGKAVGFYAAFAVAQALRALGEEPTEE